MDIPSRLRDKEIPLEYIGLSEVAWLKDDALDLIDHLSEQGSFILGGDVLEKDFYGYRPTYDNWYFNYEDGDAAQSIEHTRKYINKYPIGNYAFVLVVT